MSVPTYDRFIEPVLRFLAAHPSGAPVAEVREGVAETTGLTAEDRAALLPSGGQPVFSNRIGWAHDRLKRAGFSESPRRGFWKLTPEGQAFAAKHPKLSRAELTEFLDSLDYKARLKAKGEPAADPSPVAPAPAPSPQHASPEERIESALAELRESVGRDLLENIGRADPAFFEQLVLDLLHTMGYGTSRADLQRVGGSTTSPSRSR